MAECHVCCSDEFAGKNAYKNIKQNGIAVYKDMEVKQVNCFYLFCVNSSTCVL